MEMQSNRQVFTIEFQRGKRWFSWVSTVERVSSKISRGLFDIKVSEIITLL